MGRVGRGATWCSSTPGHRNSDARRLKGLSFPWALASRPAPRLDVCGKRRCKSTWSEYHDYPQPLRWVQRSGPARGREPPGDGDPRAGRSRRARGPRTGGTVSTSDSSPRAVPGSGSALGARCLHNAPLRRRREEETQAGSAHPWSPSQLGVLSLREQGASTAFIRAGRTEGEARERGNCPVSRQGQD